MPATSSNRSATTWTPGTTTTAGSPSSSSGSTTSSTTPPRSPAPRRSSRSSTPAGTPTPRSPRPAASSGPSDKRSRNTASNAPAAQVALLLAERTGNATYLTWAKRTIDWLRGALRDPADGLYWDAIRIDGSIDQTKWAYNQGSPVGALVQLARLTRPTDPTTADAHIAEAEDLARAALARYADPAVHLDGQGAWFIAVYLRNLVALAEVTTDAAFAEDIRSSTIAYADRSSTNRDDKGLYRFPAGYGLSFALQQAAIVDINLLAARVAGFSPTTPPPPPTTPFHPQRATWKDACVRGAPDTTATTATSTTTASTAPTGQTSTPTPPPATAIAGIPTFTG